MPDKPKPDNGQQPEIGQTAIPEIEQPNITEIEQNTNHPQVQEDDLQDQNLNLIYGGAEDAYREEFQSE